MGHNVLNNINLTNNYYVRTTSSFAQENPSHVIYKEFILPSIIWSMNYTSSIGHKRYMLESLPLKTKPTH